MRYRHLRRTTIAVLASIAVTLLVLAGIARLLTLPSVRRTVARWAADRLEAATGARLHVDDLEWGLLPPRVVMHGVTLEGRGFAGRADLVTASFSEIHPAHRVLKLGTVSAKNVYVTFKGVELRPRPRSRPWFKLEIRHLDLENVNVEGLRLPGRLGLGVEDLRAAWTTTGRTPRGFATVRRVRLRLPGLEPVAARVEARFRIENGVHIPRWRVRGRGFDLIGGGTLRGGGLQLEFAGPLDLESVGRLIDDPGLLAGRCELDGRLDTRIGELLRVGVRSSRIEAAGFRVNDLAGTITLSAHGLRGTLRRGRIFGGSVSGSYELGAFKAPFPHRVHLTADGLVLEELLASLHVPRAGLAGTARAEASLQWNGRRIKAGHGRATAAIRPAAGRLPVAGTVDIGLEGDGLLHFQAPKLRVGSGVVHWEGPLALGTWEPAWSVTATSARLADLGHLVNRWVGATVIPGDLRGRADARVALAGPWHDLRVDFRVEAAPIRFGPLALDHAVIDAAIADSTLRINHAAYRLGRGGGEISGNIGWGAAAGNDQLRLKLTGRALPLARIAGWFGAGRLVSGTLAFTGGLRGPIELPRGSWALGFQDARIGPQPLGDGSASIDLDDATFRVKALTCDAGIGGRAHWNVRAETLGGHFQWRGLAAAPFGTVATHLLGGSVDGEMDFEWQLGDLLTGTLQVSSPGASLSFELDRRRLTGALRLKGIAAATARLERRPDGTYAGEAETTIHSLAALLRRMIATTPGEVVPDGTGHGRFTVTWAEGGLPRIDGAIERLDLSLGEVHGGLVERARLHFGDDGFRLAGLWVKGGKGRELFVRLKIARDGTLSGNLTGNSDARLLQLFLPEWEPAGQVRGVLEILGSLSRPRFEGIAEVHQASFRIPDSQLIVSGIDGTVLLSPGRLTLDGLDFRLMNGRGTAGGSVLLGEAGLELELAGTIRRAAFDLFPGLSPRLTGTWSLRGPLDGLVLAGDLTVERTLLRRNDTLAEILIDWFGKNRGGAKSSLPRLDITVRADHTIEARNPFLRMIGSASLHLTGTPAAPGLVGKVEILEGGEFTFQGIRYELDRCVITFSDPSRIAAHVDIQARATVDTYDVTVTITGTGDRMIPTFTSDPPLAQEDILALLATGRRRAGESGGPGLGLAGTLLSRSLTEAIDRRARSLLAVDQVRIDPFAESSTGNATARVTVVKQLSPRWTVALESNLTANREAVVFSRWTLAPQVFLEATRQRDGSWALDLKLRKRY